MTGFHVLHVFLLGDAGPRPFACRASASRTTSLSENDMFLALASCFRTQVVRFGLSDVWRTGKSGMAQVSCLQRVALHIRVSSPHHTTLHYNATRRKNPSASFCTFASSESVKFSPVRSSISISHLMIFQPLRHKILPHCKAVKIKHFYLF